MCHRYTYRAHHRPLFAILVTLATLSYSGDWRRSKDLRRRSSFDTRTHMLFLFSRLFLSSPYLPLYEILFIFRFFLSSLHFFFFLLFCATSSKLWPCFSSFRGNWIVEIKFILEGGYLSKFVPFPFRIFIYFGGFFFFLLSLDFLILVKRCFRYFRASVSTQMIWFRAENYTSESKLTFSRNLWKMTNTIYCFV